MKENGNSGKQPDRKNNPVSGNVIWYLLAVGITMTVAVTLLNSRQQAEIQFSDLWRLIEQGPPPAVAKKAGEPVPAVVAPITAATPLLEGMPSIPS